ncbi:hypothetical protein NEOLI_003659 [Neolecta irregularis DAH-3]|uniref:Uncharacterized protein n=1 Tax=Neolecta irregularis (strain DAH-3) TaxID=1198029 RepID=A0A1U7LS68_NEOID|nr:hypothetical protein NEOLI_003659 [Neolecta irregularis DAH-3]|eukprot:OLL25507.1 hypothetical protein NEOLI_003659 [Neolecta irregularis DAH-3]
MCKLRLRQYFKTTHRKTTKIAMAFPVSQPVPSYSANYPEQSFSDPFLQKVTNQKLEQKSRHSNSQSLDDSPPSTPSQSRPPSRIASYLSIASMAVAQNSSALANIFKSADLSPSSPHNNINLFPEMKEVRRVSDTNIKATETNSYSLILGSGVLFLLGFSIARTVGTLQKASEFLPPSSHLVYQSPLACGAGALLLGILLPIIDQSTNTNIQRDVNGAPWSIIIRVIGGLVAFTWAANVKASVDIKLASRSGTRSNESRAMVHI